MLLNGIKIIRGSGLPIRGQQKQATKKILKIMVRRIKHTAEPFTHFFNPVHDCISMYMQFLGRQSQALSVFQIDKQCFRFLYKGIIIKHNKTEPTYTKTSLFLCEKRRFFMARREKGVVPIIYFEKERGKSF